MLVIDILVITACVAATVLWWRKEHSVVALAAVLLVAGYAVWDHRWQAITALLFAVIYAIALLIRHFRPSEKRAPVSTALFALATLCVVLSFYWYPVNDLPEPTGSHPVGVRDFALADESRPGLFGTDEHEPRRLLVRVWYPAATVEGFARRPYFTEAEAATTARGLGQAAGAGFLLQYIKHADTNSYVDAPIIQADTALPTVFYSHGYTSYAGQNTSLMEELASHGYIVYSVHHTYDGSAVVFPDDTVIEQDPELANMFATATEEGPDPDEAAAFGGSTQDQRYQGHLNLRQDYAAKIGRIADPSAQIWIDDRLFVHDQLQQGNAPESVADILALSNFTSTGQMGMSFGGSTTGGLCMFDTRCAAGVNLDGGDYHTTPFNAQIPVPFLMMYSDYELLIRSLRDPGDTKPIYGFNDFSYERLETAGLASHVYRITVSNVAHLGYSDAAWFMRNPMKAPLLGEIPGDVMLPLQNDFVLAFLDKYLRGKATDFPAAQLKQYQDWAEQEDTGHIRDWWLQKHPEDEAVKVTMTTSLGEIQLAIFPQRAPVSANNFLAYVEGGHYQGASLYRVTKKQGNSSIAVVQGGLLAHTMAGNGAEYAAPMLPLPPIQHETTDITGIDNEAGTVAYARLAPGSAGSEFFFNLEDNPVLNTNNGGPDRDGFGYATFGRVISGLNILRGMQALPLEGTTGIDMLQGQILTEPLVIQNIEVVQ